MSFWGRYVPVAERRAKAMKQMDKLRKKGQTILPVEIAGRTIARSFWGKGWCEHLESFSDYANRLPRGRTYVRNGSICHLEIQSGRINAIVSGSELYHIAITIKKLKADSWQDIKTQCSGHIGSMLELLQGKLSNQVMAIVTDRQRGLFPQPGEIKLNCDCPDWATMCKHVAAVLYGVGHRLDNHPELLFLLRDVDAVELITAEMALPDIAANKAEDVLAGDELGDIFGIDLDTDIEIESKPNAKSATKTATKKASKTQRRATKSVASTQKRKPLTTAKKQPAVVSAENLSSTLPKIRPTGPSVARLRKQQNLSVSAFAKKLGVATASVYRWEATPGRLILRDRPLRALAELHQQSKKK